MLTNPGLVRVTKHQRIGFLGAGESLVKTSRPVVEEVLIDLARRAIHKVYGALADFETQIEGQRAREVLRGLVGVLARPVDRALA